MEKLYGNQRKILLYIYKHRNQDLIRFNIPDQLSSIPSYETRLYLTGLMKSGYILYVGLNDTIRLTPKGLSYFPSETNDNIEICIKSIIFPITVSFITTLLTLWLKGSL